MLLVGVDCCWSTYLLSMVVRYGLVFVVGVDADVCCLLLVVVG